MFLRIYTALVLLPTLVLGQIQKSANVFAKDGESASLWCQSQNKFEDCKWISPQGVDCLFDMESEVCSLDSNIYLEPSNRGNNQNCSIVLGVVKESYHGQWKCSLKSTQSGKYFSETVNVTVAKQAHVEFFPVYGALTIAAGTSTNLSCYARRGRPVGDFLWAFEDGNGETVPYEAGNRSQKIEEDAQGYLDLIDTIEYEASVEHQGKALGCIYQQNDPSSGQVLFSAKDEINLIITYIGEPFVKSLEPSKAVVGDNLKITILFEAVPKPRNEDIMWKIQKKDEDLITVPISNSSFKTQNYESNPMVEVGENQFEVNLVINNIQMEEANFKHSFSIANREPLTNKIVDSRVHEFNVFVTDCSTKTRNVLIIVSCVLIAILVILCLVLSAKRKGKCCFKKEVTTNNQTQDITEFDELNSNQRPILRNTSRP